MDPNKQIIELIDGNVFRVQRTRLCSFDEALAEAFKNIGVKTPNVFEMPEFGPIQLYSKNSYKTVGFKIKQLNLKTTYAISNGVLLPYFQVNPQYISTTGIWTPPKTMDLWFIINCQLGSNHFVSSVFLAAVNNTIRRGVTDPKAGTFRFKLPNIFDHGALCMGDRFHIEEKTLQAVITKTVDHVNNSTWNNHIIPTNEQLTNYTHKLFKFDPATCKSIEYNDPQDWTTYCTRYSSNFVDEILN